jgi:hypothetical protein
LCLSAGGPQIVSALRWMYATEYEGTARHMSRTAQGWQSAMWISNNKHELRPYIADLQMNAEKASGALYRWELPPPSERTAIMRRRVPQGAVEFKRMPFSIQLACDTPRCEHTGVRHPRNACRCVWRVWPTRRRYQGLLHPDEAEGYYAKMEYRARGGTAPLSLNFHTSLRLVGNCSARLSYRRAHRTGGWVFWRREASLILPRIEPRIVQR